MEATAHAFVRSLGLTLHTQEDGRMQGWARVHARCDYRRPLRYLDEVRVRLLVRAKRPSSLSYDFHFSRDGEPVARGALTVVCVAREPGSQDLRPVPMPPTIAREVEVAPPEVLDPSEA
jgi:acyl-CoA thioesterase FadM